MKTGYLRVNEQLTNRDEQWNALSEAGCEHVFEEGTTINAMDRNELDECLASLAEGDTLVIWRLDVLGKQMSDLVHFIEDLGSRGIHFTSLQERLTSRGLMGQMMHNLLQAFMENDKSVNRMRMEQVRRAAVEKGVKFGRKEGCVNRKNRDKPLQCKQLYENGSSVQQIMATLNIRTASTVYRYLRQQGVKPGELVARGQLTKRDLTALKKDLFDSHHQLGLFD